MTLLLSCICGICSGGLLADFFFLGGAVSGRLPDFSAPAAALVGLLIAGLEYRGRKGKKQKRAPLFFLLLNASMGIVSTSLWIYRLING